MRSLDGLSLRFARKHLRQPGVLLLGNYRPSLAIARALGPLGYRVVVAGRGGEGVAEYSRHAETADSFPDSDGAQAWWRDPHALSRMGIDIVLPIEETYSRLIAERADSLSSEFLWATPPARAVLACLDKPAMFERCRDLGVPTEPFVKTTRRELVAAIGTIGLPCVVRPSDSTRRVDGEKAIILESPAQLGQSSCLDDLPADAALIVQKKASGARENIYFAASRGALIGVCQAHIARTDRLDGSGLAVEGATVEPDADLIRWTQSLTRSLDYTGVGCAQFLMGRGANEAAFLEINPRIAGNHAIAERAGLPLAKLSIELANGKRNNSRMIIGKKDLRFAWTYGDMRGLREAVRGGKLSQRAAAHWAGRIVAAALSADLHMTFSPWDPLPTLVLMARQLGLGRLFETKYRPYFPLGEAAQR